ncbi:MAG: DNA-binding response regulator [Zetaproteobacteria bacterium]|nr:MAG: DNA-binding response regulator [Zetaproteobacteria bacterium]
MRILIVDDHPLFREGIVHLLEDMGMTHEFLQVNSLAEAQRALERHGDGIDLVLLDQELPDGAGLHWLKDIRTQYPTLKVLMISGWTDVLLMRDAMRLGAVGYIPKTTQIGVIYAAIELVLAGGQYFPPELLAQTTAHERVSSVKDTLTARQRQVLRLIRRGLSNKEIARILGISESTVKAHVTSILRQQGVSSRARLISSLHEFSEDE